MSRGIRAICPHCGYPHWNSELRYEDTLGRSPEDLKKFLDTCWRCKRDMSEPPQVEQYESVCINGRWVRRLKS